MQINFSAERCTPRRALPVAMCGMDGGMCFLIDASVLQSHVRILGVWIGKPQGEAVFTAGFHQTDAVASFGCFSVTLALLVPCGISSQPHRRREYRLRILVPKGKQPSVLVNLQINWEIPPFAGAFGLLCQPYDKGRKAACQGFSFLWNSAEKAALMNEKHRQGVKWFRHMAFLRMSWYTFQTLCAVTLEGNGFTVRKAYALFDFDGTIITGDSLLLFCRYAYGRGLCNTKQLLCGAWAGVKYVLKISSATQSKMEVLAFLKGMTQTQMDALAEDFCREVLRPRLRPEALEKINMHCENGAEILLITASPSFYLQPLQKDLRCAEVIGTRMDISVEGIATGLISGENCKGLQKPLRLAEYLAAKGDRLMYDDSYAYGDTTNDLPMLELCAHKVAVNAGRTMQRKLENVEGSVFVNWSK